MGGWKTKIGVILLGISGAADALAGVFPGANQVAEALRILAGMFLATGIAHKIEKAGKER
jgi:hypothetical protein